MDISKLKEAIKTIEESKWIEANPSSRLNADTIISLIDCAQRVIDAAEVLPKKFTQEEIEKCGCVACCEGTGGCYKKFHNRIIDECTAIVAKNFIRRDSLPTVEEILSIIDSHLEYDDVHKDVNGLKDAAQAIHEMMAK